MTTRNDTAVLALEDMRRRLQARALDAGWRKRDGDGSRSDPTGHSLSGIPGGELESFSFEISDVFVGIVVFDWKREADLETIVVRGAIGIVHTPARLLLEALTGSKVIGVAVSDSYIEARIVNTDGTYVAAEQVVDLLSVESQHVLGRLADVENLLGLIRSRGVVPFVGSVADIHSMDSFHAAHAEAQLIVALLASMDRSREARQALREYEWLGSEDAWSPREYRRFVRQVVRMFDMGPRFSLPATKPMWPVCDARDRLPQNPWQVIAAQRRATEPRREAVSVVRATSKGKTREELRVQLEGELDQRGASMDPSMIDTTLDLLVVERMRFGRARIILSAVHGLYALIGPFRKWSKKLNGRQTDEPVGERDPALLKAPDRAAYPILSIGAERVSVELDPASQSRLHYVMQASPPGVGDARTVEVWFTWDDGLGQAGSRINVHIGDQFVGRLDTRASEHFRPAIEAAAERDEDPWMMASLYLSARSGDGTPYVLRLALPVATL